MADGLRPEDMIELDFSEKERPAKIETKPNPDGARLIQRHYEWIKSGNWRTISCPKCNISNPKPEEYATSTRKGYQCQYIDKETCPYLPSYSLEKDVLEIIRKNKFAYERQVLETYIIKLRMICDAYKDKLDAPDA